MAPDDADACSVREVDAATLIVVQPIERIVRDEQRPIQVKPVREAREVSHRGHADGCLDHAAEHEAHPQLLSPARHAQPGSQPTRFHQLEIDAPHASARQGFYIGQRLARLVRHHRDGRVRLNIAHAREVVPAHWLLDQLEPESLEAFDQADGFVG